MGAGIPTRLMLRTALPKPAVWPGGRTAMSTTEMVSGLPRNLALLAVHRAQLLRFIGDRSRETLLRRRMLAGALQTQLTANMSSLLGFGLHGRQAPGAFTTILQILWERRGP